MSIDWKEKMDWVVSDDETSPMPENFERGRYQCYVRLARMLGRLMSPVLDGNLVFEMLALFPDIIIHADDDVVDNFSQLLIAARDGDAKEAIRLNGRTLLAIRKQLFPSLTFDRVSLAQVFSFFINDFEEVLKDGED